MRYALYFRRNRKKPGSRCELLLSVNNQKLKLKIVVFSKAFAATYWQSLLYSAGGLVVNHSVMIMVMTMIRWWWQWCTGGQVVIPFPPTYHPLRDQRRPLPMMTTLPAPTGALSGWRQHFPFFQLNHIVHLHCGNDKTVCSASEEWPSQTPFVVSWLKA